MKKDLIPSNYIPNFYSTKYYPLETEFIFYNAVKDGCIEIVEDINKVPFTERPGFGELSSDKLQSFKLHFAITAGIIARMCILNGLSQSESYNMSDYYIKALDYITTPEGISTLHNEMCLSYTKRMRVILHSDIKSKPVRLCLDYIYSNFESKVTMNDLEQETGLTRSYLCRLFKKETGYTPSEYILRTKLDISKNLLTYTDMSIAEIAEMLSFSSSNYYITVFKKTFDTTPAAFRSQGLSHAFESSTREAPFYIR